MPEGHVIHGLARDLRRAFPKGRALKASSPQGRFSSSATLIDGLPLESADAVGKHLFLTFDTGRPERVVWIHLGLIGKFDIHPLAEPVGKVRLRLTDGITAADLHGPQWCRLCTEEDAAEALKKQGADPLGEKERNEEAAGRALKTVSRSKKAIGSLLLRQDLFAGVGNIFRAEVLFRRHIHPAQPGNTLTDAELDAMWEDLVFLMHVALDHGQIDTVEPEHTPEAMGREPRVDAHGGEVYVYRRAGQACYVCGSRISRETIEGRNLFWCPGCQKRRRRKARAHAYRA